MLTGNGFDIYVFHCEDSDGESVELVTDDSDVYSLALTLTDEGGDFKNCFIVVKNGKESVLYFDRVDHLVGSDIEDFWGVERLGQPVTVIVDSVLSFQLMDASRWW